MGHGDAMLLQHRRVADAGELEKLGRADGAGSEDHLAARGDPPWRAALAEVETGDAPPVEHQRLGLRLGQHGEVGALQGRAQERLGARPAQAAPLVHLRSEEHTSELQSLMRISYAVFCLQKKKTSHIDHTQYTTTT